jgi:hypothetical protein
LARATLLSGVALAANGRPTCLHGEIAARVRRSFALEFKFFFAFQAAESPPAVPAKHFQKVGMQHAITPAGRK